MARPKLPRKSTNIDMTAMCDVAFLLLSFFILATEFKPAEAVEITTPTSVASKPAPEKDVVLLSITTDGKVFLMVDDAEQKKEIVSELNKNRSLGLTEADINRASAAPFFGTPVSQLKAALALPADKYVGPSFPGIPAKDTANNEVNDWMRAVKVAYTGKRMNLLLKGDMNSKYPTLKNVINAFKANDFMKFQMVTNPENVPEGTELFRTGKRTE
ncbi:MAG TPA: biopolymer transporter ExbD [Chitinophagaceae bacterium]